MSEHEFEIYLSLLSRFLRLKPDQRGEIADELRDHLAERLEELTAEGLSREEAIHRALEEFGDAADLAAHFTQLSRRRKRRLIMRCTVGTVITTAVLILIATAFWPENRAVNLPPQLVAQDQADTNNKKQPAKPKPATETESSEAKVERILESPIELDLVDMPLSDVFDYISDISKVRFFIDIKTFDELGIDKHQVINFQNERDPVSLRTALEMILEQAEGFEDIGITIRGSFIYVTVKGRNLKIEIYNVRDLLEGVEGKLIFRGQAVERVGSGGGGGFFSVTDSEKGNKQTDQPHMPQGPVVVYRQSPGEALSSVITSTVQPESWETNDGYGSIEEFNGLLVVRTNQNVHREIEQLLKMMREAAKENTVRKKKFPQRGGGFGSSGGFGSPGGFGSGFGSTTGGFGASSHGGFGASLGQPGTRPAAGQPRTNRRNVPEAGTKRE